MICSCCYCAAMRRMREQARADVEDESARSAKEGLFGARSPGSKSRFREFSTTRYVLFVSDGYFGRRPGRHWPTTWPRPMPKPDFVVRAKELRIVEEVTRIVEKLRGPHKKLGDTNDYRRELIAEAVVFALESNTPLEAVRRAESRLRKQYRELV